MLVKVDLQALKWELHIAFVSQIFFAFPTPNYLKMQKIMPSPWAVEKH